jgi:hypothetical protein
VRDLEDKAVANGYHDHDFINYSFDMATTDNSTAVNSTFRKKNNPLFYGRLVVDSRTASPVGPLIR